MADIDTEREARIRAKLFHARALACDLHRETLHGPPPLATTMALADAVTLLSHDIDAERLARQTAERERDVVRAMAPKWVRGEVGFELRVGDQVAIGRIAPCIGSTEWWVVSVPLWAPGGGSRRHSERCVDRDAAARAVGALRARPPFGVEPEYVAGFVERNRGALLGIVRGAFGDA